MARKVRVLRILEYIYDDAEVMASDMAHWQIQGVARPNHRMLIRSTTMPLETVPPDYGLDEPDLELGTQVRAFFGDAHDRTRIEGELVGKSNGEQYLIRTADGKQEWWRSILVEQVNGGS